MFFASVAVDIGIVEAHWDVVVVAQMVQTFCLYGEACQLEFQVLISSLKTI